MVQAPNQTTRNSHDSRPRRFRQPPQEFAHQQERRAGGGDVLANAYEDSMLAKAATVDVADALWREQERVARGGSALPPAPVSAEGWFGKVTGGGAYVTPAWWTLLVGLRLKTKSRWGWMSSMCGLLAARLNQVFGSSMQ